MAEVVDAITTKPTTVVDKAKAAIMPQNILGSLFKLKAEPSTAAPDPKTVKPIDLSEIDQLFAGTGAAPADLEKRIPELVQNRVTYGSANKEQFLKDWLASNEAVKNYSPEAQRNDPSGYQAAVKKNEILNSAANKLRYELPNPMTYNIRKDFSEAINPEFNPETPANTPQTGGGEPVGAVPPPRPATATSEGVAGPLPEDVKVTKKEVEKAGFDWDKVGQIAKDTGMGILGVIQAAIAGRTAGLQGRNLDWDKDTMLGREEGKRAQEQARQDALSQIEGDRDFQMQKMQADQQFAAEQNQLTQEYQAAMQAAKSEDEKAAMQAQFDQRWKELQVQGQQRLNEIAASRQTTKPAQGGGWSDSLGIMGAK
jgi:hypothetical protein